ncbi:MAG: protein kinase domain-containing protein [Longimicrobiaceae bacterium]
MSTPREPEAGTSRTSSLPTLPDHPQQIGPYRIVRVLGEGGMGVVYLAWQAEPVRREVALKILKPGMDTRQVVARFESERQALAVMEHPGIARVFDAGATEAGRPYFVMERVDGVPLTEYCDARRLSVRERVRLFVQVCRAVQHAHQKGVIHRDLKPSNVLVGTHDGEPHCKVIDFGIAKATAPSAGEPAQLTQLDQAMGTPAYMSPEQAEASGLDVDTRADIYSLGVLLYQLLAGTLPFDPAAYRGWGFVAQALGREPPAPGTRLAALPAGEQERIAAARVTTPAALRRGLRGELGWIVLKALEKDRDRRYDTANGLGLELERFLADEPVQAGPPSRRYRLRKFVHRHRAGVGFGAALLLLLLAFAATMTVQAGRIARARGVAEARQAQAEDLIGFMVGDLRTRLAPLGRLDVLDDVGKKALAYFAAVPAEQLSDEELYRRSEALRQLGEVRADQGKLDEAMESFRQSLALSRGLAARDPANPEWQLGLAYSHYWMGYVHFVRQEVDAALRDFVPYVRITEGLVAAHPDSARYRLELSYAHGNVASALEAKGDYRGALRENLATLVVKQALVDRDPADPELRVALAISHNKVGVLQRRLGDLPAALAHHRAELALEEALVAAQPENAAWLGALATGRGYLAWMLVARGAPDAAARQWRGALEVHLRQAAADTTNMATRLSVAIDERGLAAALLAQDSAGAALAPAESSRRRLEALLARDPASPQWRRQLALSLTLEGRVLNARSQGARAAAAERRALEILRAQRAAAPADPELRLYHANASLALGIALAQPGRGAEARAEWSRALAELEPAAGTAPSTDQLAAWAEALLYLDRRDAARPAVAELLRRGYRSPPFVRLARSRGLVP